MKTKRRLALVTLLLTFGVAGGTATWFTLRPEEPPAGDAEQRYEDIPRTEYEQWMQDLGYTD